MISMQKKFIFIHFPKTGGNSIQHVLKDHSEDKIVILNERQDGIERFGIQNSRYNTSKHSTLSEYKSELALDTYNSLFKFSTIRNPWERLISYYFSPHSGTTEWNRENFLNLILRTKTLRQYLCEYPNSSARLDANIDFLMRFEHLEYDFKKVCKKLDIPLSNITCRNASTREHYSKYYDDKLIDIVGKKFAEEIEYGDYTFAESAKEIEYE